VRIIAVTHVAASRGPTSGVGEAARKRLASGRPRFTGQHAFGGVGRAVRNKLGTYKVDEIMATR
jgi:hypothetical protein